MDEERASAELDARIEQHVSSEASLQAEMVSFSGKFQQFSETSKASTGAFAEKGAALQAATHRMHSAEVLVKKSKQLKAELAKEHKLLKEREAAKEAELAKASELRRKVCALCDTLREELGEEPA